MEALVNRGLLWTCGTLCLAMLAGLWLILLGQGRDLLDCVVDHKGVHITTYLMEPTALRLMLRLRSPALAHQAVTGPAGTVLMVQTREIAEGDLPGTALAGKGHGAAVCAQLVDAPGRALQRLPV